MNVKTLLGNDCTGPFSLTAANALDVLHLKITWEKVIITVLLAIGSLQLTETNAVAM